MLLLVLVSIFIGVVVAIIVVFFTVLELGDQDDADVLQVHFEVEGGVVVELDFPDVGLDVFAREGAHEVLYYIVD